MRKIACVAIVLGCLLSIAMLRANPIVPFPDLPPPASQVLAFDLSGEPKPLLKSVTIERSLFPIAEGWYDVEGSIDTTEGPLAYTGKATVRQVGEKYVLRWLYEGGGILVGRGIRRGDALYVAFSREGQVDIAEYQIQSGKLVDRQPETMKFSRKFAE